MLLHPSLLHLLLFLSQNIFHPIFPLSHLLLCPLLYPFYAFSSPTPPPRFLFILPPPLPFSLFLPPSYPPLSYFLSFLLPIPVSNPLLLLTLPLHFSHSSLLSVCVICWLCTYRYLGVCGCVCVSLHLYISLSLSLSLVISLPEILHPPNKNEYYFLLFSVQKFSSRYTNKQKNKFQFSITKAGVQLCMYSKNRVSILYMYRMIPNL